MINKPVLLAISGVAIALVGGMAVVRDLSREPAKRSITGEAMSETFHEAAVADKRTGPKPGTIANLIAPCGLFPQYVESVEFNQTHWAVIQVAPRKKRWWEKNEPSFYTFNAKFGTVKVTTKDGFVCKSEGVEVDHDTRRTMEIMDMLNKPYGLMTRALELGPLERKPYPAKPAPQPDTGGN